MFFIFNTFFIFDFYPAGRQIMILIVTNCFLTWHTRLLWVMFGWWTGVHRSKKAMRNPGLTELVNEGEAKESLKRIKARAIFFLARLQRKSHKTLLCIWTSEGTGYWYSVVLLFLNKMSAALAIYFTKFFVNLEKAVCMASKFLYFQCLGGGYFLGSKWWRWVICYWTFY